jgi:KDO2-lipid IV(A) lauroyltransferase
MWRHLILLVFEVAQTSRKIRETTFRKYVRVTNGRALIEAMLADRPVVIGTAHFGNFEIGGYFLGMLGFPTHSVARTLDNPYLNRWLNTFRGRTGQKLIPKSGSAEQIAEVLASHGTMALLADQHAGPKGCWVQFFNRPASAHKAVAIFVLSHDAPLVVGSARRVGKILDYELVIDEVLDPRSGGEATSNVRVLTQWYTSRWEQIIREAPEQYWWLHDRWRDTRPKKPPPAKQHAA